MIITCEKCNASFNLDESRLKATGSKVRCSVCKHAFVAYPPAPTEEREMPGVAPLPVSEPEVSEPPRMEEDVTAEPEVPEALEDITDEAEEALADIDIDKDQEREPGSAPEKELNELGFELETEADLVEDEAKVVETAEVAEADLLEMEAEIEAELGELDFDLEPEAEAEEAPETVEADILELETEPEKELNELGFELETETEEGEFETGTDVEPEDAEMDLSELEGIETEEAPVMEAEADKEEVIGFVTDLEEDEIETGDEPVFESADEDLSDLELGDTDETDEFESGIEEEAGELELDLEEEPAAEKAEVEAQIEEESEDLELDMTELEDIEAEETSVMETGADEEEAELDFDFDFESQEKEDEASVESEADHVEAEEVDLSELDKMLETYEGEITEEGVDEEPEELELDLELMPGTAGEAEAETALDASEHLDLSDIDEMLQAEGAEAEIEVPEEGEEIDLDLDLELEMDAVQDEGESKDLELELDLEGDETLLVGADERLGELEIEDEEKTQLVDVDLGAEKTAEPKHVGMFDSTIEVAALPELKEIQEVKAKEKAARVEALKPKPVKKKGLSVPVIILAVIVILIGGGGYGVYNLLQTSGVGIGDVFKGDVIQNIKDLIKGEARGIDKIEILQDTITSKFISNSKAGRLFYVKGRVKNGHSNARKFISIRGNLYKKGKVFATTVTAFGGNVLTETELSNLDLDSINNQLQIQAGQNNSNANVEPGQTVQFMIVFSNLPDDMEEYELESAGSLPVAK